MYNPQKELTNPKPESLSMLNFRSGAKNKLIS